MAIFSGNLAACKPSTTNGTGDQTRDYVYVGDVVALEKEGVECGAYNVGTGDESSVKELYERLRRISGLKLSPEHGAAKPGERLRSSVDASKAATLLGWRQQVTLEVGLEMTLRSFSAGSNDL